MNLRPIKLGVPAMSLLGSYGAEEPGLKRRIGQFPRQRPAEPGPPIISTAERIY